MVEAIKEEATKNWPLLLLVLLLRQPQKYLFLLEKYLLRKSKIRKSVKSLRNV